MLLIDQGGKRVRKVCDQCHRFMVGRGEICLNCRRKSNPMLKAAARNARLLFTRAKALQADLNLQRRAV